MKCPLCIKRQKPGWQPIESAPKDGSFILAVIQGLHPETLKPFCPAVVFWDSHNGCFSEEGIPEEKSWSDLLSHWMPLPANPIFAEAAE